MGIDAVTYFRARVEKAKYTSEVMLGFPGSALGYNMGMDGLRAVEQLEARIQELQRRLEMAHEHCCNCGKTADTCIFGPVGT